MTARTTRGDVYIALAVFFTSLGYFYAFHRLGWFMQDEGVLYYQYLRVYRGQLPYRDFFVGYPPLVYYLTAVAFRVFGISINATRVLMGVLNATTAAMLYLVARRVTSRGFALIPAALLPALHPADSAVMIFHNSPYPSWYALAFGIAGTWAMLRALEASSERGRARWLVVTGVFGGLTFLSKQNAGIFFLWGVSGYLVSSPEDLPGAGVPSRRSAAAAEGSPLLEPACPHAVPEKRAGGSPSPGRIDLVWIVRAAYLSLVPLAALVLVKSYLSVATATLFVVPLAALAALGSARLFHSSGPSPEAAPSDPTRPPDPSAEGFGTSAAGLRSAEPQAEASTLRRAPEDGSGVRAGSGPAEPMVRGPASLAGTQRLRGARAWWTLLWPLIAVGAGVAVTVAPWVAYFGMQIGVGSFLKTLFFIGADVDLNSYVPFPAAQEVTLLLLGPLALWGLLAWIAEQRWPRVAAGGVVRLRQLLAGVATGMLLVALGSQAAVIERLVGFKYNLWQIYYTTSDAIDNLAAYGALLVLLGAAAVAWRQRRGRVLTEDPPPAAWLCILWIAACTFLVYYPRMDNAHLVSAAPLVYVVGTGLLPRLRQGVVDTLGGRRQWRAVVCFNAACLAVMLFVVALKAAPKVYSRVMLAGPAQGGVWWIETPQVRLRFARGDIYVPIYLQHSRVHNQAFNDLIAYLNAQLPPGAPLFAFPALPMVYFISGHDNVTRQDYFFGDNVSFPEQLEVIRTLEQARVPVVVVVNDPTEYFVMKGSDYTRVISAYLNRRYYLERRFGPYDVMRRYGAPPTQNGDPDDLAAVRTRTADAAP